MDRVLILSKYLGVNKTELIYLGCGCSASAYLYKGKVYKLTIDEEDYVTAKHLVGKSKKYKHFIKVYKTKVIDIEYTFFGNPCTTRLFLIVTELVKPISEYGDEGVNLSSLFQRKANNLDELWTLVRYSFNVRSFLHGESELSLDTKYKFDLEDELTITLIQQFISTAESLKRMGYKSWDNHSGNVSFHDGVIKLLDFGCAHAQRRYSNKGKIKLDLTLNNES